MPTRTYLIQQEPVEQNISLLLRGEEAKKCSSGHVQGTHSRKSIRRFIKLLLGINKPQYFFHQTLTFSKIIDDELYARELLKKLLDSLGQAFPKLAVIWIQEIQDRGSIHYHLILLPLGLEHPPKQSEYDELRKAVFSRWNRLNGDALSPRANQLRVRELSDYTFWYFLKKLTLAAGPLKRERHWFGVRLGKSIEENSSHITKKQIRVIFQRYFPTTSKRQKELEALPPKFTRGDMGEMRKLVELLDGTWEGHKRRTLDVKGKVSDEKYLFYMNRERAAFHSKYNKQKRCKPEF